MSDDCLGIGKLVEAIEKGTREFRELAKTYLQPIVKEKGELHADRIRFDRQVQAIKMMKTADQLLQEAGIEQRTLNRKIVVPLLEHASLESDEGLTLKWAGLLASSVSGSPIHVSFPNTLAELTPMEARILDQLFTWEKVWERSGWIPSEYTIGKLRIAVGALKDELVIAAENLIRLRLCRLDEAWNPVASYDREDEVHLQLTPLGDSFLRACHGPTQMSHADTNQKKDGIKRNE